MQPLVAEVVNLGRPGGLPRSAGRRAWPAHAIPARAAADSNPLPAQKTECRALLTGEARRRRLISADAEALWEARTRTCSMRPSRQDRT